MRITPSILNADFANLRHEIGRIPGADGVHVDVMDNHFVPNLTIGLPVVECLRKVTDQLLDIHLMIEDPDRWAPTYAEAGVESVTFHVEAAHAPIRLARELRARGARASMALKPATPIEPYAEMLDELDMVLLMSVNPGFGGQEFIPYTIDKLQQLRQMMDRQGLDIDIEVDGGINLENVTDVLNAGANIIVAGSAVYRGDAADNVQRFLEIMG